MTLASEGDAGIEGFFQDTEGSSRHGAGWKKCNVHIIFL